MTSFQISLDRWLTSEPSDDYTPFCEQVDELLPNMVWDYMDAHSVSIQPAVDDLYWKLYRKEGITPERAANIVARIFIERAATMPKP